MNTKELLGLKVKEYRKQKDFLNIIAKEAEVNGLMLTHFWPEELPEKYLEEAKSIFSKTVVAEEGKIIDLSKIKEKGEGIR